MHTSYNKNSHYSVPDGSSGDSSTLPWRSQRSIWQWSVRWWLAMACLLLIGTNLLFGSGVIVAQAATSSPTLVVSPTSFVGNTSCSYSQSQGWTCTATLSRGDKLSKNLSWTTSSTPGIVFTPSTGVLPPGGTASVSIAVPNTVCPSNTALSFKGPSNTVKVPWSCTPPKLTVTPTSFVAGTNCPVATGGWTCTATLAESAGSQGQLTWSASTALSGVTFTPANGSLSPAVSSTVSIFVPTNACVDGNFTFSGVKSNVVSTTWKCTPPVTATLKVTPTTLSPSSTSCSSSAGSSQCSVTLSETSTSTSNVTWTATSSLSVVSFTPSSGTLAPGGSVKVTIASIPCQNGTFTFSGGQGVTPAKAAWSCKPPPVLTVTPTSLSPSSTNCSSASQCSVTLGETASSQGNANWSASSTLSGVTFSPTSGQLTPGGSVVVKISSLPCQNGTITFSGAEGETPVTVNWSCTSPTLTVSPTSLDPTNAACTATGSMYRCSVTINAQGGAVNWSASASASLGSSVTFIPASGTLSPGTPQTVNIGSLPCQNGTLTFAGQTGVTPVNVSWSCTPPPPPTLTVTPGSLDQTNSQCSATGSTYQCSVSLGETASSQGNANWTVNSGMGVSFNPVSGQLTPGSSVSVTISSLPCQNGTITFSGSEGETPVTVNWSCTLPPPVLTVSPTSMDQNNAQCALTNSVYQCTVRLGETATSQGSVNWSASAAGLSGVSFSPSSGTLSPGGTKDVIISAIPCQNGSFIFSGPSGSGVSPVKVSWSCTPPSSTLTVTPKNLDQNNAQCSVSGSTYQCTVTLGETASSQGGVSWSTSASSGLSGVIFNPQSGGLSPGGSIRVSIASIPCRSGTFTFSGSGGVLPVTVAWSCTQTPPTLTVSSTNLDPTNANCTGGFSNPQCKITLGETATSQGNVSWAVSSSLNGVVFIPQNGTLSPGGFISVLITSIPCQNGTFTFSGSGGASSVSVSWSCTPPPPPPVLTVTPTSLSPVIQGCRQSQCTVTLGETATSPSSINWSASSNQSGVVFNPSSGTLSPGNTVSVSISSLPCPQATLTFSGSGGASPVTASWSCTLTPPVLTVTPTSLDPNNANCIVQGNTAYQCTVTLGETATSQNNASWSASSDVGGVSFNPASGVLNPGGSMPVTIDIPVRSCTNTNGTLTFAGPSGSGVTPATVAWNCTSPTLTITPSSLDQTSSNCTFTGGYFQCDVLLAETSSSQGNLNWAAPAGDPITPANGTLSPGQSATVVISSLPCANVNIPFNYGASGGSLNSSVTLSWNCTPTAPTLTVTPTSLDPANANCALAHATYQCNVTLAETTTSGGSVTWSASSNLNGVTFSQLGGTLSPGGSTQLTIYGIPCQNGSFGFFGTSNSGTVNPGIASWTCTPTLVVTPTSLDPTNANCAFANGAEQCNVTLANPVGSQGNVSWSASASSSLTGVVFYPANGTLSPGQSTQVIISGIPCQNGSFTFSGGSGSVTVSWSCTPTAPTLTVTPASLDPTNANCVFANGAYQCKITLAETVSSQGPVAWSTGSGLSGVSFNPSNGTLSPGQSTPVTISAIPCQSGSFAFQYGQGQLSVPWSCTSTPPTLTVTPTSLGPTNGNCSPSGGTSKCTVILAETRNSQGTVNWSVAASSALGGVSFSPSSGQLTPGTSATVTISTIPCQNGSFSFSGGQAPVSVSWSCTPTQPTLTVTPMNLDPTQLNCSLGVGTYKCTVSLGVTSNSQTSANWTASASSSLTGVAFSPANGTLSPGGSTQVTISAIPCQNGTFTFSGQSGVTPVAVQWSCTPAPPTLTVTPTSLDPTNTNCAFVGGANQCKVTLAETANSQGTVNWSASASSGLGSGVIFNPASGMLSPGGSTLVTISGIPCQNGSFTFTGTSVSPLSVTWSCTQAPPTLTVSPTSLDPTKAACSLVSGTNQCQVTLAEPANSQGTVNWSVAASGNLSGVAFTPASSGTLSPGQQVQVTIATIPCQNGNFTFSGTSGSVTLSPVIVQWSCTSTPPTLTVAPPMLDPSNVNCAFGVATYQCVVSVGESSTSQGALNWTAGSNLTGVSFSPASGALSPGGSTPVTISGIPCQQASLTFSGQSGVTPVAVQWNCASTSPTLTVDSPALDPTNANCIAANGSIQCTETLGETSTSQGTLSWTTGSGLSGVSFSPASGTLSPGQSTQVTISAIPCQSGSFIFSGQTGVSPVTVPWSCTPAAPTLTVTPPNLDPSNANCSYSAGTYQCTLSLAETLNSQGNASWTTASGLSGVSFSPASGTLSPGQSTQVTISAIPCQNGSFTFSAGANQVLAGWSCASTPTTLAVSPPSLDQNNANCFPTAGSYECLVYLQETSTSQGALNWTASSSPGGVSFSPASGTLSPGQSTQVTISAIPCQNATFTFSGAAAGPVAVPWSCAPTPPTLTVNPASLNQISTQCSSSGSAYQCAITLGETNNSQGDLSWNASSNLSGVTFNQSSGTLSPGGLTSISITSIPCQNGSFTFSGGVGPVVVQWSCAVPVLTVTPTSLDPTNAHCTPTGSTFQCTVSLGESASSLANANWSVQSSLGVSFNPASGQLTPGGSLVTVTIASLPCQNGTITFSGAEGETPVTVPWSCAPPPVLTVTPTSLDPTSSQCTQVDNSYECTVSLGETAGSQGPANWTVSTNMGSNVNFDPVSGQLTPGSTVTVTIFTLACQDGTITFSGAERETPVTVSWSCTPTVTAQSITSTTGVSFSGTVAAVTDVGNSQASQLTASINWGDGTGASSGTVNGSNGGFSVNGSHTYATGGSYTFTVTVTDTNTGLMGTGTGTATVLAALTVTPTSLDQNSCTLSGSLYQCTVTLGESSGSVGTVNWTASSNLSGVTFTPTSGQLKPGSSVSVTVSSLPCQNGTITFSGAGGESPVTVSWSCTPSP